MKQMVHKKSLIMYFDGAQMNLHDLVLHGVAFVCNVGLAQWDSKDPLDAT